MAGEEVDTSVISLNREGGVLFSSCLGPLHTCEKMVPEHNVIKLMRLADREWACKADSFSSGDT